MAEMDWYEKHKKDVAAALKKGKGASKDDGVPCTLVKMKDGSALLCAGVSGSKAAALVKEAKAAGGKVLSSGTLYQGPDGPTFAVSEGSTSVKALFTAALTAIGAPMNVTIVEALPAGEVPPPPPSPPPPPPGPSDAKAGFTDLLRQVRPRYQQAVDANPPNKAALEKGMSAAVTAAKENDFAKGLKFLQAVDAALQKTTVPEGSTPPPPPPPPSSTVPPPPPAPPATAAIQAALSKIVPLVKNAVATNPDRKTELLEPLKRCQDHLTNGRAVEAKAALFDLNRVLKELNGAPPPPPPPTGKAPTKEESEGKETAEEEKSGTAPTSDVPTPPVVDAGAFKTRLKEVMPLYKEAVEKAPDRKDELAKLATQAGAAGQAKDFPKALDLLDQLEARSRSALRAAGAKKEIETAAGKGNVAFRKWRAEKLSAASALKGLQSAILGDAESASTVPDWDVITREAGRLGEMVEVFDKFDSDLESNLEAYYVAAPAERDAPRAAALDIVQKYRKTLKDDPAYEELDNGAYGPIKIASVITAALDGLAVALQ